MNVAKPLYFDSVSHKEDEPISIDLPFIIADPQQPTLQELCRINVRRVIRSNIYKCHPELSKVRKRPKKPKKKPAHGMSNLNIIPMSMGMMILRQFDQDHNMSDSEDNDVLPRAMRNLDSDEEEDNHGDTETDDERDKATGVEDDEVQSEGSAKKEICDKLREEESEQCSKSHLDNGKEKDKGKNDKEDDASDYGTDEEGDSSKAIDEVAAANGASGRRSDLDRALDRALASKIDQMKEIIASEFAACSSSSGNNHAEIVPPDAPNLSDSDDDDDGIQYGVEEFLKYGSTVRSSESNRKLRYPSNTSVDTSTTSGIGSYNEEHLDAEMCRSDSEKTSPGWSHMEAEPTKSCDKHQPMDFAEAADDEDEDKDEDREDEEEDIPDITPKVSLSHLLQEEVEKLPLPAALRSYLLFYRC